MTRLGALAGMLAGAAAPVLAQDGSMIVTDSGDTAWLLAASLVALLTALPGIALFHAGGASARNVLSILLQTGAIAAAASLAWIVTGYTLAFGDVTGGWLGGGNAWMLISLGNVRLGTSVPESAFVLFQIVLAMLASTLLAGAWAGRARFGFTVAFGALWSLLVLAPVSHWARGGGWLYQGVGTLDHAGGLSLLVPAGISALVLAALIGGRRDAKARSEPAFSPSLVLVGAGFAWIGLIAICGGAAGFASDDAAAAMIAAHAAACAGALTALLTDRLTGKRPSASGFARGLVTGLAAALSGALYVSPGGAIVLGLAGALVFRGVSRLVRASGIDDRLEVFATFGAPAAAGALLTAVLAAPQLGGTGYDEGMNMIAQGVAQAIGLGVIAAWSAVVSAILAVAISTFLPMRVGEDAEAEGLDLASHGEHA